MLMCFVPLEVKVKVIITVGPKSPQSQNGEVKMAQNILYSLELHTAVFESARLGLKGKMMAKVFKEKVRVCVLKNE